MMLRSRTTLTAALVVVPLLFLLTGFLLFTFPSPHFSNTLNRIKTSLGSSEPSEQNPPPPSQPPPIFKPPPPTYVPIVDNFPSLIGKDGQELGLPPVPAWNRPPSVHVPDNTPLFIGFTRNWLLLQQVVVSYIAAGWPPEDIYVVENTGTMNSNALGKLTLQNPFYLNYHRLKDIFKVNVITTPALLTFTQLQMFYMSYALEKGWSTYFWGHMDAAIVPREDWVDPHSKEFKSFYTRAVEELRVALDPSYGKWGLRFFAYDRLELVNLEAFMAVGGWDQQISYYMTDCDFHERLAMEGWRLNDTDIGLIYDLASSVEDCLVFFRYEPYDDLNSPGTLNSEAFEQFRQTFDDLQRWKMNTEGQSRNIWQTRQQGGEGEPFYKNAIGFDRGIEITVETGKAIYAEKWGHRQCNLRGSGREASKAWLYEKDW